MIVENKRSAISAGCGDPEKSRYVRMECQATIPEDGQGQAGVVSRFKQYTSWFELINVDAPPL